MVRMVIALAASDPLKHYTVTISGGGLNKFVRDTWAINESKAKANVVFRYSEQLNWHVSKLQKYIKDNRCSVVAVESDPPK